MKILRKILHLIGIILAGFILALIFVCVCAPFVNDRSAASIVHKLKEISLPEHTKYIDSVSVAEKLVGNGNGMQYFGAILIKSKLSLDELDDYFDGFRKTEWDCIVEEQTGQKIKAIEHRDISFEAEMLPGE